jgi:chitinase
MHSATRAFIPYDDPQSIEIKTRYAKENHLGGIMFWESSLDRDGELLGVIARSRR